MKTTITVIFSLLVFILGGLIVGPNFIDWNQYKPQAQAQIKELAGYDAQFNGDLSLALIPMPRLYIEDVEISAPAGKFASLGRLDVNVAPMPLLSGNIVVQSVSLVKPDILIEMPKEGRPNWMTPQIEALLSQSKAQNESQSGGQDFTQAISLEALRIDEGRLALNLGANPIELSDINLDIAAETLKGPFELGGDIIFQGKKLAFDAVLGALEAGATSMSVKTEGQYDAIGFTYAGVVGLQAPFEVQGETTLEMPRLAAGGVDLKDIAFKGIVTGSSKALAVNNGHIDLNGQKASLDLEATFQPLFAKVNVQAAEMMNLDQFLPKNGGGQGVDDITKLLPETLVMPLMFDAQAQIDTPGMIYNDQIYKAVDLSVSKQGQVFTTKIDIGEAPGPAKIAATADLKFGAKTVHNQSDVYSEPVLSLGVQAQTPNLPFTLQAITGQESLPVGVVKSGSFDLAGVMTPGKVELKPSTATLDGARYQLSGSLKGKDLLANVGAQGGQLIVKGALGSEALLDNMTVQVKHPDLQKALKPYAPDLAANDLLAGPVDFYTSIKQEGSIYQLSGIQAKIINTSLTGDVRYDGGASKPAVQGDLAFGDLVLPVVSKKTSGASSAAGGSRKWVSDKIDTAWMSSVDADFEVTANSIKQGAWDLKQPSLSFKVKDGTLQIDELTAGLFGGQVAMNATVTAQGSAPLSVVAQPSLTNVQIEQLVKALAGNAIVKGRGQVNFAADIQASGHSQDALVKALNGTATTAGQDLVLEGFDLTRFAAALSEETRPGDTLLGVWNGASKGGSTAFDTMDGAFDIKNGVANITKLDLDGPKASIATEGAANLPAYTLKTAHTITLKERQDVPPFTINIEGPLNNPGQTFAQGALEDYFARKINRKLEKLLTDKLGLPSGRQQPQQVSPSGGEQGDEPRREREEITPEKALQGILEGLIR